MPHTPEEVREAAEKRDALVAEAIALEEEYGMLVQLHEEGEGARGMILQFPVLGGKRTSLLGVMGRDRVTVICREIRDRGLRASFHAESSEAFVKAAPSPGEGE